MLMLLMSNKGYLPFFSFQEYTEMKTGIFLLKLN